MGEKSLAKEKKELFQALTFSLGGKCREPHPEDYFILLGDRVGGEGRGRSRGLDPHDSTSSVLTRKFLTDQLRVHFWGWLKLQLGIKPHLETWFK